MINPEITRQELNTQEGQAVVLRQIGRDLNSPEVSAVLEKYGFNPELFNKIMHLESSVLIGEPIVEEFPPKNPVENLTIYKCQTADGKPMEVVRVSAYNIHTLKTRLRKPESASVGFEAILVEEGTITYSLAKGYEGVAAGVYVAGDEREEVQLHPGDLLIIPRGVARQITEVSGVTYVYLSDPWDNFDVPVEVYD